jgi:hypothetical protein
MTDQRRRLALPAETAAGLTVRERLVLFCVESGTDWQQVSGGGETVTAMIENGLITGGVGGALTLSGRGRAVLRAMLPEL